ncbi:MAG: hypothetical protein AAF243_01800 [Cyanobacteria bacterium P01_A01_bin.137]
MLDRLVRPLVRTQIQLLAQTQSANTRLMGMVSQWLGYLGVNADVTHLKTEQGRIQISLAVGKPEQCTENEWSKILTNIEQNSDESDAETELTYVEMTQGQKSKVHRLLASVIQAGNKNAVQSWDSLYPQLATMGMNKSMLENIRSAMKVPTMLDTLLEDLEPEVAAYVLSKAITIALIDREINQDEDTVLKSIYGALETKARV